MFKAVRKAAISVAITAVLAGSAFAQAKYQFDVAPQPLGKALNAFAAQAGINVYFDPPEVEGIEAKAVKAELSVEEALRQLLEGTGLTYQNADEKTVRILSAERAVSKPVAQSQTLHGEEMRLAQVESGGTSRAETEGEPSEAAPSDAAKGEDTKLEEIVVTAQKRVERLQEVPISISVLDGNQLDRSGIASVGEALNMVPGVSITGLGGSGIQGGGMQLAVRGVTTPTAILGGGSAIAYYLDSVPFALVRTATVPDTNPYDLNRVEVLKGPQGTLYGASAANGVVRVLTKDADLGGYDLKARVLGSNTQDGGDNYSGDLAVNVPVISDRLAFRAVLGKAHESGWIDGPLGEDINDSEQTTARIKVKAELLDNLTLAASAWHSRTDFGGPSTSAHNRTTAALLPQPTTVTFNAYGVNLDYEFASAVLTSSTSYLDYESPNHFDLTVPGLGITPALLDLLGLPLSAADVFTRLSARVLSEELLLNSTGSGPWKWTAGLFYRDAKDRFYEANPLIFPVALNLDPDIDNSSESIAVFGQVSRRFLDDALELAIGGRYFHDEVRSFEEAILEEEETFDSTTPRVTLSWYPNDNLSIYSSYAEGFRSGYFQSPRIAASLALAGGFPPVKADKLKNYELGAKGTLFGNRLSFDTAVFYMDWQDVQRNLAIFFNGACCSNVFVNGESASGFGADLGLAARLFEGFDVGLNYGWNDLTMDADVLSNNRILFSKGDRLDRSPEHTVSVSAQYKHSIGSGGYQGRIAASANYVSRQGGHESLPSLGRPAVISYAMRDVRASVAIDSPDGRWTAKIFGENLTDEHSSPLVFASITDWSERVRPRTIGLQVDYRFVNK
jgi:iron complex outermembrane recepter protein